MPIKQTGHNGHPRTRARIRERPRKINTFNTHARAREIHFTTGTPQSGTEWNETAILTIYSRYSELQGLLTYRRKYQGVLQTFFFCPDPPFCGTYRAGAHAGEIASRKRALRARAHQTSRRPQKKLVRFFPDRQNAGYFRQWTVQKDLKRAGKLTNRHYIDASIFYADKRRENTSKLTKSVLDREMYFLSPVMARKRFYLTSFVYIDQSKKMKGL